MQVLKPKPVDLTDTMEPMFDTLRLEAHPNQIRHGLKTLMDTLSPHLVDQNDLGTLELILAEVLNNVTEHAYKEAGVGRIDVSTQIAKNHIAFHVVDWGVEMPGLTLPEGKLASLNVDLQDLPEGTENPKDIDIHNIAQFPSNC